MIPPDRAFHGGYVDDAVVTCASRQSAYGASPVPCEVFDVAALQEPRGVGLWPAPPSFTQDTGGDGRREPSSQGHSVKRPHDPVTLLGRRPSARVVRKALTFMRFVLAYQTPPDKKRSSKSSPAANSSGVKAPATCSHSATPRRPSRTRSRRSAASDSQALKETPSPAGASSAALATSESIDTDLFTTATTNMVGRRVRVAKPWRTPQTNSGLARVQLVSALVTRARWRLLGPPGRYPSG